MRLEVEKELKYLKMNPLMTIRYWEDSTVRASTLTKSIILRGGYDWVSQWCNPCVCFIRIYIELKWYNKLGKISLWNMINILNIDFGFKFIILDLL